MDTTITVAAATADLPPPHTHTHTHARDHNLPHHHSHVFESVDEDKVLEATSSGISSSKAGVDGQIRALEVALEELRRKRGT